MDPVHPAGTGASPDVERAAAQRRVLRVLVCTQVLGGVGVSIGLAVSTLAAARMSGSDAIGGTALTCAVIGAAGAAVLVARIATRAGRRPSLTTGYLIGAVGGLIAVLAAELDLWPLLLAGLVLLGAATAAGLAARFAATDLAATERRGRALAVVVWATTVGAVAGPNLGAPAQQLAGPIGLAPLAGPFLVCTVVFTLAAAGDLGRPAAGSAAAGPAGRGVRSGRDLDRGEPRRRPCRAARRTGGPARGGRDRAVPPGDGRGDVDDPGAHGPRRRDPAARRPGDQRARGRHVRAEPGVRLADRPGWGRGSCSRSARRCWWPPAW